MIQRPLRGLVLLCLLAGPAWAWPLAVNQRIDRALHPGHESRAVVAGHVEAHLVDELSGAAWGPVPPLSEVVFHVDHVLLGEGPEAGARLRFSTRSFEWPTDLVPMKRDARAFLIYDPRREEGMDGYVLTVVPWSGEAPPPVQDRDAVKGLLATELVEALAAEASVPRRRALVRQMIPLLSPAQAEGAFLPLLDSEDEWLRRAAVAGLASASPEAAHVERAVADLEAFIQKTPANGRIPAPGGDYAAYALLFEYYAFLDTGWSEEERQGLQHCLPLFRVVARELEKEPHYQWEYGVRALAHLGTEEDLDLLLAYYQSHETNAEGAIFERPYVRFTVMTKLAELLGVELVATLESGGIRREADQQRLFREAVAARH